MPDANEQLYDLIVSHQIYLTRYSTRTLRGIVRLIDQCEADVTAELARGGTELTRQRLGRMLDALRGIHAAAYAEIAARLEEAAGELAEYEGAWIGEAVEAAAPPGPVRLAIRTEWVVPAPEQLRAAVEARPFQGKLLSEVAAEMGQAAYVRVRDAVRQGFAEGQTSDQIVRRIRGTRAARYKDGVTEISRRGAEAVVRTALNHTANYARQATLEQNTDVVDRLRWVSTLDMRTSPICRARDGQTFPVDSGPRPPAHWNCRSTMAPVMKSWADLGIDLPELPEGTRASMSGQVPASETYQTWLARQPAATQDEVLGPTRGRLFRAGKLPLERFVDATGHEYTLEELRRRDAAAFRRAGLAKS